MPIGDLLQKTTENVKPREMPPSRIKIKEVKEETVRITVEIPKTVMDRVNKAIALKQPNQKKKITWAAFIRDCVIDVVGEEGKIL